MVPAADTRHTADPLHRPQRRGRPTQTTLDGPHDFDNEARTTPIDPYADALIAAQRVYGDRGDVPASGGDGETDGCLRRNADEHTACGGWQAIHGEIDRHRIRPS